MSSIVLIVPGPIETRTGGYEYDRRMAAGLRARGWSVTIRELEGAFPHPTKEDSRRAGEVLAAIPTGAIVLADGLAFSAIPEEVEREAARLRFAAIVHMPLAAETGLSAAAARELENRERRALAAARLVIVTGRNTTDVVAGYGVSRDRLALVEPGVDRAPLAKGRRDPSVVHLVCVATLSPGKGHDILFRALASIEGRAWRLTCVGSVDRYPEAIDRLRAILREHHLEDRVALVGHVDAEGLASAYDSADVFVLATLHETYGMAVAEALAHGVPVVSTDTGAIAELVGDEAGIVVPPGNERVLAHALSSAMDPRVREKLAEGARRVRDRLMSWDDAVVKMEAALERVGA